MAYIDTPRNKKTLHISSVKDRNPAYLSNPRDDYAIIHSKYQLDTFDRSTAKWDAYEIKYNNQTRQYYIDTTPHKYSSRKIFKSSSVLPYFPGFQFSEYYKEIQLLGPRLLSPYRSRVLYRLSEKWVVDDLGRFFYFQKDSHLRPNQYKLCWMRYNLSKDCRNIKTLTNDPPKKLSLSLAIYTFVGLAGYNPLIQDYFINSGRYQFHHVEENKLDLRPTSVVPLEVELHNYIHDQYTESNGWFKRSKIFYI